MLKHYYDGTLQSNKVRVVSEKGIVAKAEIGEAATITVEIDDPAGTLDFVGYKTWRMDEDACPVGSRTVWRGYVGNQVIGRGDDDLVHGTARRWTLTLHEDNGLLARRLLISDAANRPAETVSARLAWLLTQPGFSGLIFDHGLIESSTVQMDPANYHGRRGADVLRDLSLVSGYNHYVRYREASTDVELAFYDPDVSPLDVSTLRISNVSTDIDLATTWPADMAVELERSPSRIGSGVHVSYSGGSQYVSRAATEAAFAAVDQDTPSAAVKTRSAALALASRLLDQHDEQDERIPTVRIRLPAAKLNDVRQGQRIRARLSHLPGWTSFRAARVVSKASSRPENLSQDVYDVDLELSPAAALIVQSVSARVGDAGQLTLTLGSPVAAGNLLVVVARKRNLNSSGGLPETANVGSLIGRAVNFTVWGLADIRAGDAFGPDRMKVMYAVAVGDEQTLVVGANKLQYTLYELSGASTAGVQTLSLSSQGASSSKSLGSFSGGSVLQIGGFLWDAGALDQTVGSGWTQDDQTNDLTTGAHPGTLAMHATTRPAVAISGGSYEWGGVAVAFP